MPCALLSCALPPSTSQVVWAENNVDKPTESQKEYLAQLLCRELILLSSSCRVPVGLRGRTGSSPRCGHPSPPGFLTVSRGNTAAASKAR